MMEQYWRIKADHPDAILFFHLGDFYEAFFDDAETLAREMDVVLTKRNGNPMAGVPIRRGETYINGLLKRGHKVAICRQVEDPSQATGLVKREVVRVVTPGTAVEEELLEAGENNFLVSLFPASSAGPFGLAVLDLSTGEFACTEAPDLSSLRGELSRIAPSELLLPEESAIEASFLEEVPRSRRPRDRFTVARMGSEALGLSEPALRAAGGALDYVEATQKGVLEHIRPLTSYELASQMDLDAFTVGSLELVQSLRGRGRSGTVLGALDAAITPMGRRRLRRWILAPSARREVIEARLDAVEAMHGQTIPRQELRQLASEIHDLERLIGRLGAGRFPPPHLQQLLASLDAIPRIHAALALPWDASGAQEGGEPPEELRRILQALDDPELREITEPLRGMLVDQPPADLREGGIIREGYDEPLDRLRDTARELRDRIAGLEAREKERTGIPSLKVGYNRVYGYYLEVTRTHLDKVPPEYRRRQTLANAERFVVEELTRYDEQIADAEEQAVSREQRLYQEAIDGLRRRIPKLQLLADAIAQLDVYAALAQIAAERRYVRPTFTDDGTLLIEDGRHPVVERVEEFVPNGLRLDAGTHVVIVTGPNMAGKSVFLRQVALISLMAQIGSFVPASRAVLPVVDKLFARVGASDALVEGISTFMMEMLEVAAILERATPRSLIILDEMGRGTSTYDGMSIAWAVADELATKLKARTLFATHYQELTRLAEQRSSVINMHVAVKEVGREVVFLHRVEPGTSRGSYGVHVARLAGLPDRVTEAAEAILSSMLASAPHAGGQPTDPAADPLPLFGSEDHPAIKALRGTDLDRMTPLEALQLLARLKDQL
jgi:DNA mismatch repair protein MutS